MAVTNIGAMLGYGHPGGVLCKIGVVGTCEGGSGSATVRVVAKKNHALALSTHLKDDGKEKRMGVDEDAFKGGCSQLYLTPTHLSADFH